MQGGELDAQQVVERGLAFLRAPIELESEEAGSRNVGDAVRAARDLVPVEQDDPDDLAEAERDDREIVAAQPQHGKAQQHAEGRGEQAGQRQAGPEAEPEGLREQGVGVGPDRVEGDVAEVEQAGETDHDVQSPAEHDVDQDGGGDVDHVAAGEGHERQDDGEDEASRGEPPGLRGDRPADRGHPRRHDEPALDAAEPGQRQTSREHDRREQEDPFEVEREGHAGRAARGPHAEHGCQQHEGDDRGEERVLQGRAHGGARCGRGGGGGRHRPRPSRSRACPAGRWAGRSRPPPGCRTRPRPYIGC